MVELDTLALFRSSIVSNDAFSPEKGPFGKVVKSLALVGRSLTGNLRDRALIVLLLHTGLRAREICRLGRDQLKLAKRSGFLEIIGKRNKYCEVPLNATARKMLEEYLPTLPPDAVFLFPSAKTREALSERALGYIVKKYARMARLPDVSLHDLRHRFGYRMAESVPLHRLAQITGHDSLDTTKLYIQGTKQDLQQAAQTIAWT